MNTQKLISREYKIMMHANQFQGDANAINLAASTFWQRFRKAIKGIALDTGGRFDETKWRSIRFYDTSDRDLQHNDYIFRERVDEDTNEREVTLKFRHPDRFLSMKRDMSPAPRGDKDAEAKFEEDIKPQFQSLFGHSATQTIGKNRNLNKLDAPFRLFPDLPRQLETTDGQKNISIVGDLTVRELVLTGAKFQIGSTPKVEAKCALIIWYDAQGDHQRPEVAEFSFRYGNKNEDYGPKETRRAYEIYLRLQERALQDWIDREGITKTGYVYSRA